MIATRYQRKLGRPGCGGDWDIHSSISHVYRDSRTLCGRRIGLKTTQGGRWEITNYPDRDTNCAHCIRMLKNAQLQS